MIKVHKADSGKLTQLIEVGVNRLLADEPVELGGDDAGPTPHDLLDAALGACTALTVTLVARRKQMPLDDVQVEIGRHEEGGLYRMQRRVRLVGALSEEQRSYLLGIANKCPIHRALNGKFEIVTELLS
jgi:putative redox protein